MIKLCPHCLQVKHYDEFSRNKSKRLGVQTYCKNCVSARGIFTRLKLPLKTPVLRISTGDRNHYKVYDLPVGVLWKLPAHPLELFLLEADCFSEHKGRWFVYPVRGMKYVVAYRKPV